MSKVPSDLCIREALWCDSPHPDGRFGCRRQIGHDGPHWCQAAGWWPQSEASVESAYHSLASELAILVESKAKAYGNSTDKSGAILATLYPDGVKPFQYSDMLLMVRIIDKLGRISQRKEDGKDLGGESPYQDLAGYSLLGWKKDREMEVTK